MGTFNDPCMFINDPLHSLSINPEFMINYHVYHGINGHDSGTDLLEIPTMHKAYVSGRCSMGDLQDPT